MQKYIFSVLSTALTFVLLFSILYTHPDAIRTDVPPSSQEDYPVLPEDQSNAVAFASTFQTVNEDSEFVFEGTVIEELDVRTESWDEGFKYPITFDFERYRVRVDDAVRGELHQEIIVERNTIYTPSSPALTKGSTFLFFANRTSRGTYIPVGDSGYYYVAEDNRVYPTRVTENTRAYSGMSLLNFKKEIRKYRFVPPYAEKAE